MTTRATASLIAIAALVLIGASGALGYALRPVPEPELLRSGTAEVAAPVVAQAFDDGRRVQVRLITGVAQTLAVQTSGTLTASWCRDGAEISSGTVVARVDERPLIGLHSTVPLYRDISVGDEGADVAALQAELVRLGFLDGVGAAGEFGYRTGQALQKLRESAGLDAGDFSAERAEFVWLASPQMTGITCVLKVGDAVGQGAAIATSRGALERVEVHSLPENLTPGERTIKVGSVQGPVDGKGVATDAAFLAELAADEEFIAGLTQDPGSTVTATIALASPLDAYSIPAGALIGTEERSCVKTPDGIVQADLLGSSLGTAMVAFPESKSAPGSVAIGSELEDERCE